MNTSSFYCYKKQCRKSIWDTPEYITKADKKIITRLVECLDMPDYKGYEAFNKMLYATSKFSKAKGKVTERVYNMFFDRVIAWPEGVRYYMRGSESYRSAYYNYLQTDLLDKLKAALKR